MVASQKSSSPSGALDSGAPRWWNTPLALGLLGSLLLWLALPPVDWGPLGWIAPLPWLLLIRRRSWQLSPRKRAPAVEPPAPGRWRRSFRAVRRLLDPQRPYVALWWAGFLFWLGAVHWLRYPHPLTHFGWLALAFYLSFYLPVFVGLTRVCVHQLHLPLLLAAPVIWTGLELARAYLLTGFLMGALGHTQYQWIELIQISDLVGAYGVSFLVMFVAAALARMLPVAGQRMATWPLLPLTLALLGTLIYGYQRTADPPRRAGPSVALIQGNIEPNWKQDPDRARMILTHYLELSRDAGQKATRPIDLLVWPETMYRQTLADVLPDFTGTAEDKRKYTDHTQHVKEDLTTLAKLLQAPLLFGIDTIQFTGNRERYYNSAVFIDRVGTFLARYDKMHRVMFGEYIPFADWFPLLYGLTPLTGGISPGEAPQSIEIERVRYSPNICYETVIPQVIRAQVQTAKAAGAEPDVLINITNDAWFRGSSELEMHLICGVFRAVECRKPLLIAANGGVSASIDGDGRIVHRLPKLTASYLLLTDVMLEERHSFYLRTGDWFSGICLVITVLAALAGLWQTVRTSTPAS